MHRPHLALALSLIAAAGLTSGCVFPGEFDAVTQTQTQPDTTGAVGDDIAQPDVSDDVLEGDVADADDVATDIDAVDDGDADTAPTCDGDQVACDGVCVALDSNDRHCGECGLACGERQTCSDGECTCNAAELLCGSQCIQTGVGDPDNCGGCGTTCGVGEMCLIDSCVEARNQVAVGTHHTCAIADGDLYCWGANRDHQLGVLGSGFDPSVPVKLPMPDVQWREVVAGHDFSCALAANGVAYCWGKEGTALGQDGGSAEIPLEVIFADTDVRLVHLAASTDPDAPGVCGLTADGDAYCWGTLPDDGVVNQGAPRSFNAPVVDIAIEGGRICAVRQLQTQYELACQPASAAPSVAVTGLSASSRLDLGRDFGCVVNDSGKPRCWGEVERGQLGCGDCTSSTSVGGLDSSVERMSVGQASSCVIVDGSLYCWGDTSTTAIGLDPDGASTYTALRRSAEEVVDPLDPSRAFFSDALDVSVGLTNTCVMTQVTAGARLQRDVYCVGDNTRGQIGNGESTLLPQTFANHFEPTSDGGTAAVDIATTELATCVLFEDGALDCLGSGRYDLTSPPADLPTPGGTPALRFDGGTDHFCLGVDDEITCWGNPAPAAPLDDPTGAASKIAWQDSMDMPHLEHVRDVVATPNLSCALYADPSGMLAEGVHCVGETSRPLGVLVGLVSPETSALAVARDVACSRSDVPAGYTCSRLSVASTQQSPVVVTDALGAGETRVCLVTRGADTATDVHCVGPDENGLADESFSLPVDNTLLDGRLVEVAVGRDHVCVAHPTDIVGPIESAVTCLGDNRNHQLGYDNPAAGRNEFRLRDGSGAELATIAIAAAADHTCVLGRDSQSQAHVVCWGHNRYGQLGPGLPTDPRTFARVGHCTRDEDCTGALVCGQLGICVPATP